MLQTLSMVRTSKVDVSFNQILFQFSEVRFGNRISLTSIDPPAPQYGERIRSPSYAQNVRIRNIASAQRKLILSSHGRMGKRF
jgi:hypothetical protein